MTELESIELFIGDDLNHASDRMGRFAVITNTDRCLLNSADLLKHLSREAPRLAGTKLYADFRESVEALNDDQALSFHEAAAKFRGRIGLDLTHTVVSTVIFDPATIEDYFVALQAIIDRDIRWMEAGE